MAIIIKTFTTPGGKYLFDRETNSLLSVTDTEYTACQKVENATATPEDMAILQRYINQGYLKESQLEKIQHPATPYLRHQLENKVTQLTLQVCQSCNLRCAYCAYGGNYENHRTHTNAVMSLEMMKKSADFLMARSHGLPQVSLGFYGGEPFLQFDKIKALVKYVKENYPGRKITYVATTNGTIFTDDMIEFMLANNFWLGISFDGPKDLHDRNRVYADGKGSYDDIMANVIMIRDRHPEFFKRIRFQTTVAPGVDFACVNDFYDAEDVLLESGVSSNTVNTVATKEAVNYDDTYRIGFSYQMMKCLLAEIGLYPKQKTSRLFVDQIMAIKRASNGLGKGVVGKKAHPGGPCVPGVDRPFVDVYGNIHPCERLGEMADELKIGHIDTGFDLEKANAILNIGRTTEAACKACWNFAHCGLCAGYSDDGSGKLSSSMRLSLCDNLKKSTLRNLITICLLKENGGDLS